MSDDITSNLTSNKGRFVPGDPRINNKGRPPKARSLTLLLEERMAKFDLAETIANAIETGEYKFPGNERTLPLNAQDLLQLLKFVYKQVDPLKPIASLPYGAKPSSLVPQGSTMPIEIVEELFVAQIELITRYLDQETLQEFMLEWEEAMRPVAQYFEVLPANDVR